MRDGLRDLQARREKLKEQISTIDLQRDTITNQATTDRGSIDWKHDVEPIVTLPSRLREELRKDKQSAATLYNQNKKIPRSGPHKIFGSQ